MRKGKAEQGQITAHRWLLINSYGDVAAKIDKVVSRWARKGKKTRRNWWDVLAGTKNGKPKTIEGVAFPVLRAARERKGWDSTAESISRNPSEMAPPILEQPRWLNSSPSQHNHEPLK
jgi:hypothetical protein